MTARYVAIEQPGGGRVAVPVASLTTVTVRGDHVRFDSTEGVVDFAYVRRKRALLRALERAAPRAGVRPRRGDDVPDVLGPVLDGESRGGRDDAPYSAT